MSESTPTSINVLFVCLGNICRSTMAEGVFKHELRKNPEVFRKVGTVDSCGIGAWHVGNRPDYRTMSTLNRHGISDYEHAARQIRLNDFDNFDYIFGMDEDNMDDLRKLQAKKPNSKAKVQLWGVNAGEGEEIKAVPDPYYGSMKDFEEVYEQGYHKQDRVLHCWEKAK